MRAHGVPNSDVLTTLSQTYYWERNGSFAQPIEKLTVLQKFNVLAWLIEHATEIAQVRCENHTRYPELAPAPLAGRGEDADVEWILETPLGAFLSGASRKVPATV